MRHTGDQKWVQNLIVHKLVHNLWSIDPENLVQIRPEFIELPNTVNT